jgi:hypothetical protein
MVKVYVLNPSMFIIFVRRGGLKPNTGMSVKQMSLWLICSEASELTKLASVGILPSAAKYVDSIRQIE